MAEPIRERPRMPADYGIAGADAPGMLEWLDIEEKLTASRNYWVSTTRADGRPHAMPVWGLWFDGHFCFGTGPDTQKGRNIAHQPYVVVHLESGDDVVILEGKVVGLIPQGETMERFLDAYEAKYDFRPEGGMMVKPVKAFAWHEADFPTSATRWRFGESPP